ncbi:MULTISPECIES: translational GTPase TypA [Aminobacterium]|jgi:GTP-binding protein|uniref:translational GTPase TypA n=1 Tax=Aminobacterium TaxID=81466 RepID=UPI0004646F87|nr:MULTISPECIES: translational GTPase TypA [Aminobacterium]
MVSADKIRNIAIIAHIDHGKTTLIDSIFRAAQVFRKGAKVEDRVMDNNEIERERGITIRAKHCTVEWQGYLINIIDTPGHADFSGEVERILSTVDSVLLLVDANEGPMPQTRYVLMRALAMGLRPIVFINKVDRPNANPAEALDQTFDLFIELGATEEQADFPVLYGSGLDGWAVKDLEKDPHEGMDALFQTIVAYVPAPVVNREAPFLMQVSTLAWNEYTGRIGCGRVLQGSLHKGEDFLRYSTRWKNNRQKKDGWEVYSEEKTRSVQMWVTHGLDRREVEEVAAGDIVWISGPEEINIGDTFCSPEIEGKTLSPLSIEEPTVSMFFLVNTGPFSGKEGQPITLRQLKARLEREMHVNVSLRMEDLGRPDGVKVSGRGELQLSILIEEMRREGMEFCVSKPEVITKEEEGQLLEPMEELTIDVPEEYQGVIFEKLSRRKAKLLSMENTKSGLIRLIFEIPTRGLIGYRGEFLTDTRGLGIMNASISGYGPWVGEISPRNRGSMVSLDTGEATSYQLENLQERGTLFIDPGDSVYDGMIVGENSRPGDLPCNPTKRKQATNHRSATKDMTIKLDVPRKMTLEKAMEWIADDELVEVTPKSIRMRKALLDQQERKKAAKKAS